MNIQEKKKIAGGKVVLWVYIGASLVSYFYIVVTGTWNGDFIGRERVINIQLLTLVLILTILPLLYCFWIFKHNINCKFNCYYKSYSLNLLRNITWFLFISQIIILILGYGVMGTGGTEFTFSPIAIFRSLILKLKPRLWGTVYILSSDNKKNLKITYLLFCLSSIFAHSLGGIFILIILLIYKYRFISVFLRRHILISLVIFATLPALITAAYNIRGHLRGFGNMAETTYTDIIFGKLCGRISSISNNGYILENTALLIADNDIIPPFFYQYDPLHLFGIHFDFKSTGSYVDERFKRSGDPNSSTMAGPLGVMIISFSKSYSILILNLMFFLFSIPLLFLILKRMGFKNFAGMGLIISLGFAQSGDSSEITNAIFGLLFMWIILHFFQPYKDEKAQY